MSFIRELSESEAHGRAGRRTFKDLGLLPWGSLSGAYGAAWGQAVTQGDQSFPGMKATSGMLFLAAGEGSATAFVTGQKTTCALLPEPDRSASGPLNRSRASWFGSFMGSVAVGCGQGATSRPLRTSASTRL